MMTVSRLISIVIHKGSTLALACFMLVSTPVSCAAEPSKKDVLRAMKKATDFMMNTVSYRGGFLYDYAEDFSMQWGEVPARKTMIWLEGGKRFGTLGVGWMLLDVYRATGDLLYLTYAEKVANAVIWGQHPSGGWHYFIDFDMTGVEKWYDDVLSKWWGYSEYYHYYGNCTYDDNITTGATRYLMDIYMTTLDPIYRVPLLKALDFILESQYPTGGWPQRYPISHEFPHEGHEDYTSFYTYNDDVITNNIMILLEAYEKLGFDAYREAAYRGMDFVMISQYVSKNPVFQAGWGAQHDMDLKPAAAREYEPAALSPDYTISCIKDLELFYMITGNRKYLTMIPNAIAWLENSYLPEDHKMNDRVTHASFYELGTNKPLYAHREGTNMENGRYWIDYEPRNLLWHYGMQQVVDVDAVKKEFKRVSALSPEDAMAEYRYEKSLPKPVPDVDPEEVAAIINAMDGRGAWIELISESNDVKYHIKYMRDIVFNPPTEIRGIHVETFVRNMRLMLNYLKHIENKK